MQINITEIKRPELDAYLVANNIARQIEGRISFRRAIKTAIASTMRIGAEGIKVLISGRLGGAEMARREMYKEGRTPLHTLRADIDYAHAEAHTTYGRIGIKVMDCKGEIFEKWTLCLCQVLKRERRGSGAMPQGAGRRVRSKQRFNERK